MSEHSSESIYSLIRSRTEELDSLEAQLRTAREEVFSARAHYYNSVLNAAKARGSPISYGGNDPRAIALAKPSNDRTKQRAISVKEIAAKQRELAEKRLDEISKEIHSLREELRQLQAQFSSAVQIEKAQKVVSQ